MIQYDATIIQQFAQSLYNQAQRIIVLYAILGALIGAIVGIGLSLGLGQGALVVGSVGALLGGAFGASVGRYRAFTLRLQAQTALCQVQIELNSRPRSQSHQSVAQPSR